MGRLVAQRGFAPSARPRLFLNRENGEWIESDLISEGEGRNAATERRDERKPLMERFDTLVKRAGEIYARATADSAAAAVDADGRTKRRKNLNMVLSFSL